MGMPAGFAGWHSLAAGHRIDNFSLRDYEGKLLMKYLTQAVLALSLVAWVAGCNATPSSSKASPKGTNTNAGNNNTFNPSESKINKNAKNGKQIPQPPPGPEAPPSPKKNG
jgi:hypothetical protein